MFWSYVITCVISGLSCGLGCSPYINVFMSSYIITYASNVKKAFIVFFSFFAGKCLAVSIACAIASTFGERFISDEGYIKGINLSWILNIIFIGMGLIMVVKFFVGDREKCNSCGKCTMKKGMKKMPAFIAGIGYGLSPCVPFFMVLGFSTLLNIPQSIALAIIFTISNAISPMILMIIFAGFLSKYMYKEIPKYTKYIKLSCGIILIALGLIYRY